MNRREFLHRTTFATGAALVGFRPGFVAAEPPPETTRLRLARYEFDIACYAPQWVAEELLRAEGFTDIQYISLSSGAADKLAAGELDFIFSDTPGLLLQLDAGRPFLALAGVHGGCYELSATDRVRSIRDLKGRTVAVPAVGLGRQALVSAMAAYVGLDPRKDVTFVSHPAAESIQLLAAGKIDAFLGFPPEPQELRARKIGHVVVNTAVDRPWSQYFCCMAVGTREFVRLHPIATKRALRAFLKATSVCALDPERVARFLADRGYVKHYEYAAQALREIPYARWREYDAEDTLRFYALRLHEAGMIKSSPQKILAQGTDWRFLNELKKELKA